MLVCFIVPPFFNNSKLAGFCLIVASVIFLAMDAGVEPLGLAALHGMQEQRTSPVPSAIPSPASVAPTEPVPRSESLQITDDELEEMIGRRNEPFA